MIELINYKAYIVPCFCCDLDHNIIVYKRKDMDEDSYLDDYYILAPIALECPDSFWQRLKKLKDANSFHIMSNPEELGILKEVAILLDWQTEETTDEDPFPSTYWTITGKVPNYKLSLWEKLKWFFGHNYYDMRVCIGEWDGEQYIHSWLE